jgi:hypothetical protein
MKYLKLFESFDELTPEEVFSKLESDCKPYLELLRSCYTDNTELYDLDDRMEVVQYFNKEIPMIFRGSTNTWKENDIRYVEARKDRRPKDTNKKISKEIDEVFFKEYGIKPRTEGTFTTPVKHVAGHYGQVFMFFPIGDFKYLWSEEIRDMFDELRIPPNKVWSWYLWEIDPSYRRTTLDNEMRAYYSDNYTFVNFTQQDFNDLASGKDTDDFKAEEFREILNKKEEELNDILAKEKEKWMQSLIDRYNMNDEFCKAINFKNEIIFICDEYYLVKTQSWEFEEKLIKLIFDLDIEIPEDI